ncbi:MAG: hypothetical protein ACE5HU_03180 [Acidobacteriota bacterium]
MATRGARERGEIKAQVFFSLAFLILLCYLGFKFVPVYVASYDFESAMRTQAQYAGSRKPATTIMAELLNKANELELPITREDVTIKRSSSRLTITADYTVPVKTALFTYHWHFQKEESAVLF